MGRIILSLMCMMTCAWTWAQTATPDSSTPAAADSSRSALHSSSSRTYDHFFLDAIVQREKDNSAAAFDLLRHCLQLNPDAPEAHYYIGQYYAVMKNDSLYLAHTKRAAELNPDNEAYMETLAQAYIRQDKYTEAIGVVERLYDRDKSREELLEMLYQLYQQTGDYAKAIGVLERMELSDGKSERLSVAKSGLYTQMGDKKAAIAEMEALARQYPHDLNYLGMYGDMLMMNGQESKALKTYSKILAEEPDNSRVLMSLRNYHLGRQEQALADSLTTRILLGRNTSLQDKISLIRQEIQASENAGGDSTRVLSLFHQMSTLQPNADMLMLQATYMGLKAMPNDSINPVLEQVLHLEPDNAAARLRLVGNAWGDDDMDRMIALCQGGRQYNPDEMAFYYYQGVAYYKQEKLDEALSAFQNGIGVITGESDPAIVSDFYAVMGDILHQKGQPKAAYAAYDSCLVWKADNIGCLNNYAYYLSEQGEQLDKAEQMSYKTIKAEPKNATYLDTYAWILFMQKRYSEAKVYIEQTLQNKDDSLDNSVILEHAGDIYACCGDEGMAHKYWTQALEKASDKRTPLIRKKIKLKKYIRE